VGRSRALVLFLKSLRTRKPEIDISLTRIRYKSLLFWGEYGYKRSIVNKYGIVEPTCYHKASPLLFAFRRTLTGSTAHNEWIMPIKHNYSNLNSRYKGTRGNSIYAGSYRSFSDSSRSEARLATNRTWLPMTLPGPTSCEVLQSDPNYARALKNSFELFKLYEKRIHKASKKVKETFTQTNILRAYLDLYSLTDLARGYTKGVGALKLPLYQNLCNPCVLLIAYSSLKGKKASGIDDIPVENVTLASILFLSLDLRSKKYSPAYTKRVFILKANGKMKPLGIPPSKDKIVQKALLIVLEPLFENVFLDSSHGFRSGRSCHSALKEICLRWRAVKWFIECDFVSCFDKISHPIVMSIFSQHDDDYWTCNLVNRFLKKS
jgi:hypothetical protein